MSTKFTRRSFLRGAGTITGTGLGIALASCSFPPQSQAPMQTPMQTQVPASDAAPAPAPSNRAPRVLLAYFSRAGENYYYGGRTWLQRGNTEVVASMINDMADIDVFRIEAAEPYPDGYEATVQRNTEEQSAGSRPTMVGDLPALHNYDVVLLGSGVWSVRTPMIMRSFVESYDMEGKVIHPFVTYAVSGMGRVIEDYEQSCPGAIIGEGLAVRGEEAESARSEVEQWLASIGILVR
jgi:flavodoxin